MSSLTISMTPGVEGVAKKGVIGIVDVSEFNKAKAFILSSLGEKDRDILISQFDFTIHELEVGPPQWRGARNDM